MRWNFRDWLRPVDPEQEGVFTRAIERFEGLFHHVLARTGRTIARWLLRLTPRDAWQRWRRHRTLRAQEHGSSVETRRLGQLSEGVESWFFRLSSGVSDVAKHAYRLLVPEKLLVSTEQVVTEKTMDTISASREAWERVCQRLFPKWLRERAARWGRPIVWFTTFCSAWLVSRDYRRLAWSTPVLLLAVPLVGLLIMSATYSADERAQRYRATLFSAIEARDETLENLCLRKLDQLGYERRARTEYMAAVALVDQDQDWEGAAERMRGIAPEAQPGFGPAHVWIAANILHRRVHAERKWETVKLHLRHASTAAGGVDKPLLQSVGRLNVEVALHEGRTQDAIRQMESLTDDFPSLHGELMGHYVRLGDFATARRHARKATRMFEQLVRNQFEPEEPLLSPGGYIMWANAHLLLGEVDRAVETTQQGIRMHRNSEGLSSLQSQIHSHHVYRLDLSANQAVDVFRRIFRHEPRNNAAILRLVRGVLDGDQDAQRIVDELSKESVLSSYFFAVMGDVALEEERYDDALTLYQKACEMDPSAANAWNNVAWIKSHVQPLDLQKAREAATRAIETNPSPLFFETRGQVNLKLARWADATADLERALNGAIPNQAEVHQALALAYDQLGKTDIAAAHRSRQEMAR